MNSIGLLVLAGLAIPMAAWGMWDSWLRHRREIAFGSDELAPGRKAELLATENDRLKGQVGRLEERIAVLERIATDPANRTAREIEALREGDR